MSILILGGGIAGINSAVYLGEQGHKVTLIEKEKELGGKLNNLFSEFYNAVGMNILKNKGGGNYPTFEEAANELVILEAAIKSSKEKQWININNR